MVAFLLALSAVAVVVAAVLLVTWLVVQDGFTLVFVSMGFAVAAIVLLWAARRVGRTRLRAGPHATGTDLEADAGGGADAGSRTTAERLGQGDEETRELRPFPIIGYDTLWVSQIVELVAGLDLADLASVEAREQEGRRRPAVLDAVASARPSAPTAPAWTAVETQPAPTGPGSVPASVDDEEIWLVDAGPPTDPTPDGSVPADVADGDGTDDGHRGEEERPSDPLTG